MRGTRDNGLTVYTGVGVPSRSAHCPLSEFGRSLELVSKENGDIWVLGDLNYPKLGLDKRDVPYIKTGCAHTSLFGKINTYIQQQIKTCSTLNITLI